MIFVYEDKETDVLSQLFRKAYEAHCSNSFIYAGGNGNIVCMVKSILNSRDDNIIVFLDTIPGNRSINKIYRELKKLSAGNHYRVIVMNIVCAEYYFICSIKDNKNLFKRLDGIDICFNKDLFTKSALIETEEDKNKAKNFEGYCKLILIKCVIDCIRHSRRLENGELNHLYSLYYVGSCRCEYADTTCSEMSILNKAVNYVLEYPCIPIDGFLANVPYDTGEDMWKLHRKLVDEFNDMCDRYEKSDTRQDYKYSRIGYIK